MKSHLFCFLLLSVTAVVASAPALAQNGTLTRSFVSSAGSDSNPCTVTQPCASFAHAYTAIGANGIIAALDPGKYGPLTITGPVTINGNGWAAITAPAQGNGITVNAGSGNVTLTGLEIDGAGAAYNGIVFSLTGNLSKLTVSNCIVQNMVVDQHGDQNTGNGILLAPTASGTIDITITNTTVSNNGGAGLVYLPPSGSSSVNGIFDHITANANVIGIAIQAPPASGTTSISLTNSIVSNNSFAGINADITTAGLSGMLIDNVNVSSNYYGISAAGNAKFVLGHSIVANNPGAGIQNLTTPNNTTFYTYQNNEIYLNGASNVVQGSSLLPVTYQ
jgi:hypothetical protein